MVGEEEEGLLREFLFVEAHDVLEGGAEARVHLDIEYVFVDFVGVGPVDRRGYFFLQLFLHVLRERLLLRKLRRQTNTGFM